MRVGNNSYQTTFLVVPRFSNYVIMGYDWFLRHGALINYENKSLVVNGNPVPEYQVSLDRLSSERVVMSVIDDIVYVQILTAISKTEACFDLGLIKNNYYLNLNSESFNYIQCVENISKL